MKRALFLILSLLAAAGLSAAGVEKALRGGIDSLAEQYVETAGPLYSRQTVTIVGIENLSEAAEANYVGQGLAELLKPIINDSLVFKYVDRRLLGEALEEIELALSDITAGGRVDVGRIEEVALLLTGSVQEEADDFLVSLQLVEVETTSLTAAVQVRIPRQELIAEGQRIAYEYLMANGIGMSLNFTPHSSLIVPREPIVAVGDGLKHAFSIGGALSYRLSRRWKLALDTAFKVHDLLYDNRQYQDIQNIDPSARDLAISDYDLIQNSGTLVLSSTDEADAQIAAWPISYFLTQQVLSFTPSLSYVLPVTRAFNVSAGLGPVLAWVAYLQNYDAIAVLTPNINTSPDAPPAVKFARRSYRMDYFGLGVQLKLEAEYFVLPRLALNAGASYRLLHIFPPSEVDAYCTTTGEYIYSEADRALDALGLNPFRMPDGTPLNEESFSASYLRVYAGLSLYL
jgi:TolB-like protein